MAGRMGARRNPARYLAPLVLAAIIAATYVIVHKELRTITGKSSSTTTSTKTISSNSGQGTLPLHAPKGPKFYIVKKGDILSSISSKTGVSVDTLLALNPKLKDNPNTLQVGFRLRLRR
jgi:LysM repeat protein